MISCALIGGAALNWPRLLQEEAVMKQDSWSHLEKNYVGKFLINHFKGKNTYNIFISEATL